MLSFSNLPLFLFALFALTATSFAQDKAPAKPKKDIKEAVESFQESTLETEIENLKTGSGPSFELSRRNLRQRGKAAFPDALILLDHENPVVVDTVLDLLFLVGGYDKSEEKLLALYQAPRSRFGSYDFLRILETRRKAALVLGRMKSEKAFTLFLDCIAGPNALAEPVRLQTISREALGLYGPERIDKITEAFEKSYLNRDLRSASRLVLVVGRCGSDKAKTFLLEIFSKYPVKTDSVLRHHSAIALQFLGDKSVVNALVDLMEKEPDHYVQKYMARTLSALTGHKLPADATRWKSWLSSKKSEKKQDRDVNGSTVPQIDIDEFGKNSKKP